MLSYGRQCNKSLNVLVVYWSTVGPIQTSYNMYPGWSNHMWAALSTDKNTPQAVDYVKHLEPNLFVIKT